MAVVKIYGDIHSSEESAAEIQKGVYNQSPEALMLESPDLRGEEASYIINSLIQFSTLGIVYKAFNLDVKKLGEKRRQIYTTSMYKVSLKQLEKSLESLFNRFNIDTPIEKILSPRNTGLNREREKAITSLYINILSKRKTDRNTLLPRLCLILKNQDMNFHYIDTPQAIIFQAIADNISNAPSDPKKVEALMKRARKGDISSKEADKVENIMDKMEKSRNVQMSEQITEIVDSNNYRDVAAVMGRKHATPIAERLRNKGLSVRIK